MEKFVDVIKIIFEKHLIPAVLSLVLAAGVFLMTPKDYWVIKRITSTWYYLLVAGIVFLVVHLMVFLYKTVPDKLYWKKESKKFKQKEESEAMENLWSYVDRLMDADRDLLQEFLENDNKPIERPGGWYAPDSLLSNSSLVHCRVTYRDKMPVNQYVLEKSFYSSLKYSQLKYGRICHFEDDKSR